MVFANLQAHEKDAFFSLLDEYFTSRPEIFAGAGSADHASAESTPGGAAASAVHRALAANPEATSRLVSAGLRHGVPKSSPYSAATSNPEISDAVGRVAAASMAFSVRNGNSSGLPPPPPPPRRASTDSRSASPPSIADKPSTHNLVANRKFGDVDVSSTKNMFGSLRSSTANKSRSPPPPVVPSAFAAKKNMFAPPPARRTPSTSSDSPTNSHAPPPPPPPRRPPTPEEEPQGEWAEVLYDYTSEDPADLEIQAKQRVLVTERTSADWWTGEVDGRTGIFPASYVKLL